MQVYTFKTKNRLVALLVTLVVLGAGAALLFLGLALLAGLAVVGGVLGAGALGYRAIRGPTHPPLRSSSSVSGLDPALEVYPEARAIDAPAAEPNDGSRRLGPE
jgi:hypothetical protein